MSSFSLTYFLFEYDETQLPLSYITVKAVVKTINELSEKFPYIQPVSLEYSNKVEEPVLSGHTLFLPANNTKLPSGFWNRTAGHDLIHTVFNMISQHFSNFKDVPRNTEPVEGDTSYGNQQRSQENYALQVLNKIKRDLVRSAPEEDNKKRHSPYSMVQATLQFIEDDRLQDAITTVRRLLTFTDGFSDKEKQIIGSDHRIERIASSLKRKDYFTQGMKSGPTVTPQVDEDMGNMFGDILMGYIRMNEPVEKEDAMAKVHKEISSTLANLDPGKPNSYEDMVTKHLADGPRTREETGLSKPMKNYLGVLEAFIDIYNKNLQRYKQATGKQ